MKILAFILAFVVGGVIWIIPVGLLSAITKEQTGHGVGLVWILLGWLLLIWLIRSIYRFLLRKFGYEVADQSLEWDRHKSKVIKLIIYILVFTIIMLLISATLSR
ncbi:hypothetical protein [Campylobacter sp. RM16187]|uniref:hypothetical protein n=1 Tax=Campylobacter sp. RM16187 TaxID=1660063 RepID=UPI0021B6D963|nr:hypothetical protein [Campylobacter sp. RM16187]QKG29129.1 putative membrane protein [Campylobacter sp. RM16187]